jgi:hypothetical protein
VTVQAPEVYETFGAFRYPESAGRGRQIQASTDVEGEGGRMHLVDQRGMPYSSDKSAMTLTRRSPGAPLSFALHERPTFMPKPLLSFLLLPPIDR